MSKEGFERMRGGEDLGGGGRQKPSKKKKKRKTNSTTSNHISVVHPNADETESTHLLGSAAGQATVSL